MHGWVGSDWTKGDNGGLWYNSARGYGIYGVNGNKFNNGSNSAYGSAFANGDIISCALDLDNGFIMWAENGVWYNGGNPLTGANAAYTGLTGEFVTANFAQAAGAGNDTPAYYNFGQKPFKYAPPEGFKTLCLANLPRPTEAAVRPDKYFNTIIWTGTGGSSGATRQLTGVGFAPDLVWQKARSSGTSHRLMDTVRGSGTGKCLSTDDPDPEGDGNSSESLFGYLSSFDRDGFTLTNGTSTFDNGNKSGDTYVAWCWKAGGDTVSNSEGSITSQVSASPESGFSIVSYTGNATSGATIGHGLNEAPTWIIFKDRDAQTRWISYFEVLGNTKYIRIDSPAGATTDTTILNSTSPSSSVITLGTSANTNPSGNATIAYCWHDVPGLQKFGKYTGNNNADGPFVYTGFKVAWLMIIKDSSSVDWKMYDNKRSTYNQVSARLHASTNSTELSGNGQEIDFLSNGFKLRGTNGDQNSSGTFYYMAFAEAPTNNLFGGQANAR
jgi:hypothetical protein